MPFYGTTSTNAGNRPAPRYTPPAYRAPSGASDRGERQFPERIDTGGLPMELVSFGAQLPAQTLANPLKWANALTGSDPQTGQKGFVEQTVDTINGTPFLGDLARGFGKFLETSNNLAPAANNADLNMALRQIRGLRGGDALPRGAMLFMSSSTGLFDAISELAEGRATSTPTVDDLLQKAYARGYTAQDIADIQNGKKGIFDSGDKMSTSNPIVDLGGRFVMDPLNATLLLGPARLASAAAKLPGLSGVATGADKVLRLADARAKVAAIPALAAAPRGVRQGVAALRAGVGEGVTNRSLGIFLMGMGRGGAGLLKTYTKAAVGTTAFTYGVNALDDITQDDSAVPGPLNDLFRLGRAVRDDHSLDSGMLFTVWALTHFPARDLASDAIGATRRTLRLGMKEGADVRAGLIDLLSRDIKGSFKAREAAVLERFGDAAIFDDYVSHVTRKTREGQLAAAFTERPVLHTIQEFQDQGDLLNRLLDDEVRYSPPSRREVVDAAIDWGTGNRGLGENANGLRMTFDPERAIQQFLDFRQVAGKVHQALGAAGVPELRQTLIREHLEVARHQFRRAAGRDGVVPLKDAQRIINDNPALLTHEPTAQFWANLLIPDANPVEVSWIEQRLDRAMQDAHARRVVMAPAEQWAAKAERESARRYGMVRPDGTLDLERMPSSGGARVEIPTAEMTARRENGFVPETLDEVAAMRDSSRLKEIEDPETIGVLDDSGYDVDMVQQGVVGQQGGLAPGLEITFNESMSVQAMEEAAVFLMRQAGVRKGRVKLREDVALAKGLQPNTLELTWRVGGHAPETHAAAVEMLNALFPDTFTNDTTGIYRVTIPEGHRSGLRIDEASRRMAEIFPERSQGGMFDGDASAYWVRELRNTTGTNRGRAARRRRTERSFADVERDARLSPNYWAAKRGFEDRNAILAAEADLAAEAFDRGPDGLAARPGQEQGPVGPTTEVPAGTGDELADLRGPARVRGALQEAQTRVHSSFRPPAEDAPVWSKTLTKLTDRGWGADATNAGRVVEKDFGKYVAYGDDGNAIGFLDFETNQHHPIGLGGVRQVVVSEPRAGIATRLYDAAFRDHGLEFVNELGRTGMSDAGAAFVRQWLDRKIAQSVIERPAPIGARPEGLKYLQDRDAEAAAFIPNMGSLTERFGTKDAAGLEPAYALARENALYDPTYQWSVRPKGGTPFVPGQGRAFVDAVMVKQVAGDAWQYRVGSKVANFWNGLFGRVYTKALKADMKAELMNDLVAAGASPREVNRFLAALQKSVETTRLFRGQLWQRLDLLPPHQIDDIAHGRVGDMGVGWKGFNEDVFRNLGEEAASKALNRASSRMYRKLEQAARARDGQGSLGKLLDITFGSATKRMDGPVGTATRYIRAWYPVFRFYLDIRWHAMNLLEPEIISGARYGVLQPRVGSKAMQRTGVNRMEASYHELADSLASGWLDNRRLEAYIGSAFDSDRIGSTAKALKQLAEDDPVMVALRERYGRRHDGKVPTADEMVAELEQMMYDWDTIGVQQTADNAILREAQDALNAEEAAAIAADYEAMQPLIQQMTRIHQRIYRDVVHSFHGNVNRSNVERMANSYFLYWPISYQLKVAKVLFDTLTYRSFGRQTDLIGAWTVDRLTKEHAKRLAEDPGYREMFDEHPELWHAAAMFLPITPYDMGVSMSRFSRYTGSALGAQLGLWEKDADYPDLTSLEGQLRFGQRLMQMGPLFTGELIGRLSREFSD